MRKSWDWLWKWLRSTWDWFRHLKAFRDLLEILTVWKYVMLGISLITGIATSVFSWIWSLPGPLIFVLGLVATLVLLRIFSLAIEMRSKPKKGTPQWDVKETVTTSTARPPGLAFAIIGLLAVLALIGFLIPQRKVVPDAVAKIEAKLADVPNSEYRQLVAAVIYAFEPTASLAVGSLEPTPDGARSVDVELRSIRDGKPTLAAIDIVNTPSGKKVGIAAIDSADSKRLDIKASAMLLCSDTGFDDEAISKAKRKRIGLISILRQGDKRVKATIEEQIYLRRVSLVEPVTVTFDRDTTHQDLRYDESSLLYNGGSVIGWLRLRAAQIVVFNPSLQGPVVARFNLKQSALFSIGGQDVMIHSWSINFHPHTQWLKQTVQLDAKAGIYDYIRGRVRFTPGSNSYTISGIDFDKAIPLSYAPEMHEIGVGLMPGEIDAALVYVQGLAPAQGVKIADLDNLIVPNDLNPKNPQLLMQRTSQ